MLTLELILLGLLVFSCVLLKLSLNKSIECQRKANCKTRLCKLLKIKDITAEVLALYKAVTLNFMKGQSETGECVYSEMNFQKTNKQKVLLPSQMEGTSLELGLL